MNLQAIANPISGGNTRPRCRSCSPEKRRSHHPGNLDVTAGSVLILLL